MAYFNYFIKQFLRVFVKKFFWIILIVILLFFVFNNISFGAFVADNGTISYTFPDLPEGNENVTTYIARPFHPDSNWMLFTYSLTPNTHFISTGLDNGLYTITCVDNNNQVVTCYTRAGYSGGPWREFYTHTSTTQMYADQVPVAVSLHDVRFTDGSLLIEGINHEVAPSIVNTDNDIVNWSFDYLNIDMGTYDLFYTYIDQSVLKNFSLNYNYNGIDYSFGINQYLNISTHTFSIPINALTNSINIRDNATITFSVTAEGRFFDTETLSLGSYELGSDLSEDINEDSSKYVQSQILEQQTIINDNLENINDTLTDSSVEDITIDSLPQDNTTDITQEGINGIFTSIYNAFCTGQAQDIVFPIPFTDKSITVSASYTYDSLTNANANFLIIFIQAFWWYIISRFIIKDIANKINNIKSGNIENIEKTNIKEDML